MDIAENENNDTLAVEPAAQTDTVPVTDQPESVDLEKKQAQEPTPEEAVKAERQKEIDAAVEKRLARERRKFEREIAEVRAQTQAKPADKAEAPTSKPAIEQFDNIENFVEASIRYRMSEDMRESQQKARVEKFHETVRAAQEAHPDLAELLEENELDASPAMLHLLSEADSRCEMLYQLAKNPKECNRIAKLDPVQAAFEMGMLAAKTAHPQETQKSKPTSAPSPLAPVKGGGAAASDPSKLSDADWLKARRKGR